MSFSGCSWATSAVVEVPSAKVTLMALAPAMTWRAVRMAPWSLTIDAGAKAGLVLGARIRRRARPR